MVLPHGTGDLYHKYRPRRFKEIAGHKEVVGSIKQAVLNEHPSQAYLLIGESGTGKTTTARIMAMSLNCDSRGEDGEPCLECKSCKTIISGSCPDLVEVNAADNRGIGDIRSLCRTMVNMPMLLRNKVYILDEAHQLTNDAQSSLLKELEENPSHVFIILCSTHPKKILPTVKNRCQRFVFNPLRRSELLGLVEEVATLEGCDFPRAVYESVTDASGGSPRNALVMLQQVLQLGSESPEQITRLLNDGETDDPEVIKICFELSRKPKWDKLTALYKEVSHFGAPAIGMMVAGFFRNKLLKAKPADAAKFADVLSLFVVPFDDGKLGENQLVLALHRACKIMSSGTGSWSPNSNTTRTPRFKGR